MCYCHIVSEVQHANWQPRWKKKLGDEHLNLRSHCGLIETFNFRHNRKTKRFNYAIMSSCLLGRTLVNKCTTKWQDSRCYTYWSHQAWSFRRWRCSEWNGLSQFVHCSARCNHNNPYRLHTKERTQRHTPTSYMQSLLMFVSMWNVTKHLPSHAIKKKVCKIRCVVNHHFRITTAILMLLRFQTWCDETNVQNVADGQTDIIGTTSGINSV